MEVTHNEELNPGYTKYRKNLETWNIIKNMEDKEIILENEVSELLKLMHKELNIIYNDLQKSIDIEEDNPTKTYTVNTKLSDIYLPSGKDGYYVVLSDIDNIRRLIRDK